VAIPLQNSVVYGPIHSRRLGVSLGINLLPTDAKFCLSDCLYCQYGTTDRLVMKTTKLPSKEKVLSEIASDLKARAANGLLIDTLTFCGNGEPTLHPDLSDILSGVEALRDHYFPSAKIGILSDGSRAYLPRIQTTLNQFDERYMKLDAGTEALYEALNQPLAPGSWKNLINGLMGLKDLILQSLFVRGGVNNAEGEHYQAWLDVVKQLNPKAVYVYTLDRPPADPAVKAVSTDRLQAIGGEVESMLGVPAEVF